MVSPSHDFISTTPPSTPAIQDEDDGDRYHDQVPVAEEPIAKVVAKRRAAEPEGPIDEIVIQSDGKFQFLELYFNLEKIHL